jgi:hypothetical protein
VKIGDVKMPKPIVVRECKQGVEIIWATGYIVDGITQVHRELLTVEEAEDLATQLDFAAQDIRRHRESPGGEGYG